MRTKAYAELLGLVAIFAGVAVLAFSSIWLIDLFGGAALLSGLGATAWASGGTSLLKRYTAVLLLAALIGAAIFLVRLYGR